MDADPVTKASSGDGTMSKAANERSGNRKKK